MKKWIALFLASVLLLGFVSCGEKEEKPDALKDMSAVLAASSPTKTVTNGLYSVTVNGISFALKLNSTLTVNYSGYNPIAKYEYERESMPALGATQAPQKEPVVKSSGTIYSQYDTISDKNNLKFETGDTVSEWAPYEQAFTPATMVLTQENTTVVSNEKGELKVKITAANTAAVFGAEINGDVELTITYADGLVTGMQASVSTKNGGVFTITSVYTYAEETFRVPDAYTPPPAGSEDSDAE